MEVNFALLPQETILGNYALGLHYLSLIVNLNNLPAPQSELSNLHSRKAYINMHVLVIINVDRLKKVDGSDR